MKGKIEILAFFMFMICSGMVSGDDTLQTECATLFTKMTNCLAFASGKNDAPTKECCTSVTEVKDSNPACLCFFIQQVHKGDANLKSLGLQETRLLQLPSVCKLTNASVSECPKLLNLPANSPDATIFKNASNASSSPATSQSGNTQTTTAKSNSLKKTPNLTIHVALAIVEILFFTCSRWLSLFLD
ncbi:hypothetical protein Leryth_017983 [Lithospermum erythrorhizon]|uniref:Bifunctional inhibitor/plant lipid transfer protein/seed storage helical domain-containing protein n=1 Tax=Lithospermum erythrorhizon TaxID=34254 RepID=A0AAV3QVM7_LITER|nr:hypothetical protein Leryth_017983 [Lithospermum erythrorhizon]